MDEAHRALVIAPPLQTPDCAGIGGRIRRRSTDFVVEELPAYAPDGREGVHLLVALTKRDLSSEDAAVVVAKHLQIDRRELGMAGRKDRVAHTTQWISVPASAQAGLASFSHPSIDLGPPHPHGNKLRTGHLRGNRFSIVVRQLDTDPAEAIIRAQRTFDALAQQGGLANFYGPQRFGRYGHQLDRGVELLRSGRGGKRGNLVLSAGQSALFNLYAQHRRARGLWRRVLTGDLLKKREGGGMFECTEPQVDQARLDAGELLITGPMYGSRMRAPTPGTDSAALEDEVLAMVGVEASALASLGRKAVGTRRALTVDITQIELHLAAAVTDPPLGEGIELRFVLPPGCYATQVCREVLGDAEHSGNIDPD